MLFIKQSVANRTVRFSPFMPACTNTCPLHILTSFTPTYTHYRPLCLLAPFLHLCPIHACSCPISSSLHCTFYVNTLINLHIIINTMIKTNLLATFTTDIIFVRRSKHGAAVLALHVHLHLLTFSRLHPSCPLAPARTLSAQVARWG